MTILLVDDDQDDIDFFTFVLEEVDKLKTVKLLTAHNGIEALEVLSDHLDCPPDVVFLDVNMPLLNGLDTLQMLRKDERLKGLDITIYSTTPKFKGSEVCTELGAKIYQKPTTVAQLTEKLEEIINN